MSTVNLPQLALPSTYPNLLQKIEKKILSTLTTLLSGSGVTLNLVANAQHILVEWLELIGVIGYELGLLIQACSCATLTHNNQNTLHLGLANWICNLVFG